MEKSKSFATDDFVVPEGYDSEAYLWVRTSELRNRLGARLFDAVKCWLAENWPFEIPAFPGREIDWKTWRSLLQ